MRTRRWIAIAAAAAALMSPSLLAAKGQGPLETYEARLSGRDHYNSQGVPLTTAAAIIRQDRANYHQFGLRDPEDQWDNFFRTVANRARMEQMLGRPGAIDPYVRRRILNDDPVVIVEVYANWVHVTLKYP